MSLDVFWVHAVTVASFAGTTATGPAWNAPQTVTGFVDDQTHLVRNGIGEEVISQSVIFMPIESAPLFVEDSKVTLPSGRVARVITVNTNDGGGLPLPEHVEVHLT